MRQLLIFFAVILIPVICTGQDADIKEFVLMDAVSGERISLLSFKDNKGVVILFVSNECPYSNYYTERIRKMVAEFSERNVAFILVNSHLDSYESPSAMKNAWNSWDIPIPYLADKEQALQKKLNVEKSPTAVLLKPLQDGFSIYYSGMIDNNPQVANDVKEAYLTDNIKSLLQNKPPAHRNNRAIGCMIR